MASDLVTTLTGINAMVAEFLYDQLQESEDGVDQKLIQDHVTQEGKGPLPMEALENLYKAGVIENIEGPPTAASNGQPVILFHKWRLSGYGERVLARHLAKKKRGVQLPTPESKKQESKDATEDAVERETRRPAQAKMNGAARKVVKRVR